MAEAGFYAPTRCRLFRAVESGGYFGRGSYWTTRMEHVRRFAYWAEREQSAVSRSGLVIWTIEIDEPEDRVVDLIGPAFFPISSTRVDAYVAKYAKDGYRWLFFREHPAFGGDIWTQAVYLGDDALSPQLAQT